jgi:transcriptional regulator of arginine metabolism
VKDRRQRAILELVRQKPVHTQQELAETLAGMGLHATQATVSRDIQVLRERKARAALQRMLAGD